MVYWFNRIMPLMRSTAATLVLVTSCFSAACNSASRAIVPVIYAQDDQAALAMKSAPTILLVKIASAKLITYRMVEKPPEVGGPMVPRIPLHLARIQGDVLLAVRGTVSNSVEFYSWIWASGSHGGPRLFHPYPGTYHVVFLRNEGPYLHTVGDYPSYDLKLPASWVPALLSDWKSGYDNHLDPLERLIALRFRAEFEALSVDQLREDLDSDGPRANHHWATIVRLGSGSRPFLRRHSARHHLSAFCKSIGATGCVFRVRRVHPRPLRGFPPGSEG